MKERRRFPRLKLFKEINVYPKGSIKLDGIVKLRDFSLAGMSVESDSQLKPGTIVYLEAELPVELKGRLLRAKKVGSSYSYGVKFDKINYAENLKLKYITTTKPSAKQKKR